MLLAIAFGARIWLATAPQYAGGVLRRLAHRVQPVRRQPVRLRDHHEPVRGAPEYQQKVLLIGIVLALVMRGIFIAAGAALITQFVWVFYIFGAFLIYTAWTASPGRARPTTATSRRTC